MSSTHIAIPKEVNKQINMQEQVTRKFSISVHIYKPCTYTFYLQNQYYYILSKCSFTTVMPYLFTTCVPATHHITYTQLPTMYNYRNCSLDNAQHAVLQPYHTREQVLQSCIYIHSALEYPLPHTSTHPIRQQLHPWFHSQVDKCKQLTSSRNPST